MQALSEKKRIIRLPQLLDKIGVSRSSAYLLFGTPDFPKKICLSTRCVGWLESEIDQWIESRATKA
jgi:prophage regulatory protein